MPQYFEPAFGHEIQCIGATTLGSTASTSKDGAAPWPVVLNGDGGPLAENAIEILHNIGTSTWDHHHVVAPVPLRRCVLC
jgi:hypothetical protein